MSKMNLDKLIDQCPYNQKDIADYTGINKNTISKYVNNTFEKIDKYHIDLLCDFFKCTPNDLFELESVQQKMFLPSEISNWMKISDSNDIMHRYKKSFNLNNISTDIIKKNEKTLQIIDKLKKENSNTTSLTDIYISEEDYDMEQMQIRFEMEFTLSHNLFLITDYIIYNADKSELPDNFIYDINNYKNMTNSIEASKFMLVYRILYVVIVQQLKNKQLLEFIVKIRKIYSISPFFSTVQDKELQSLINESNELLRTLQLNKKD
jgi:putative transcriptional regulator